MSSTDARHMKSLRPGYRRDLAARKEDDRRIANAVARVAQARREYAPMMKGNEPNYDDYPDTKERNKAAGEVMRAERALIEVVMEAHP